jgi:beta-glucanase (GH16 family)
MRIVILLCTVACLAGCLGDQALPQTTPATETWSLAWSDEFDTELDPTVWTAEIGTGEEQGLAGWGNDELQYYTGRTDNLKVEDGHLVITAVSEDYEGASYTSARLISQNAKEIQYGRIEASIKVPSGQGLWPAFWLLGKNIDDVGWPTCGEIDIMEARGQQPSWIGGALHGPGYSGGSSLNQSYYDKEQSFDSAFHVVGVDWDQDRISWWVDGNVYHSVTRGSLQAHQEWVYDQPFFLLLNLAVGGNYVGDPNPDTPFPAEFKIDYIRVYQRN